MCCTKRKPEMLETIQHWDVFCLFVFEYEPFNPLTVRNTPVSLCGSFLPMGRATDAIISSINKGFCGLSSVMVDFSGNVVELTHQE